MIEKLIELGFTENQNIWSNPKSPKFLVSQKGDAFYKCELIAVGTKEVARQRFLLTSPALLQRLFNLAIRPKFKKVKVNKNTILSIHNESPITMIQARLWQKNGVPKNKMQPKDYLKICDIKLLDIRIFLGMSQAQFVYEFCSRTDSKLNQANYSSIEVGKQPISAVRYKLFENMAKELVGNRDVIRADGFNLGKLCK